MSRLRAVILDIDGTLIESNYAHARSYVDAGRDVGLEIDFDEVRRLIGMGGDKVLPRVAGIEEDTEKGERIKTRKGEIFRERYLPELQPTPGARALLHRLRDDGVKLVIATSANKKDMSMLLEQAGITDLIQDGTSADDAEESKPDPDIIEAAMKQAGFPAEQMLMLGDTPYDVEAASRAGLRIVAVRSGGWGDADLLGAVAVYDDPADLLSDYDDSPLGRAG